MRSIIYSSALFVAALAIGCSGTTPSDPREALREEGQSDFVSAMEGSSGGNGRSFDGTTEMAGSADPSAPADSGGETRTVEEGDIYRVLPGNLIANLNNYRGLQIIDFSDVGNPQILGRLPISGYPVELYVRGNTVFVLLNNWYGYYRYQTVNGDDDVEQWYGGVAVAIDISNPAAPVEIDRARIPGNISTSRLTTSANTAALYVATGGWAEWEDGVWDSRTVVKSFDVADSQLTPKSELNLGGYVTDIQATPEALLVARYDWNNSGYQSQVAVMDISNPDGTMVLGDEVSVAGRVESQFNMDLHNGILRIVSGSTWSGTRTNHLETFDAGNLNNLTPIDHDTFGDGEQLYATLFRGNKAFFVTYLRVDPFHAFSIDANGVATERSEFIVSGWNDFFRAVHDDTRLIGIGKDDQNGNTVAVSLYDITDLDNPNPLLQRANVAASNSWSEANWDHRAFSVVENAVDAVGPNGEAETGLVLLPYQGYNADWQEYTTAVQVFTFSPTSLTRRGSMSHGTPVRRSFLADTDTTANLSGVEISFFDTQNPDQCVELSRLELAPNYTDYLPFGDHAVRVKNNADYWGWWGNTDNAPDDALQIVSRNADPDATDALRELAVPANARTHRAGDHVVSVGTRYIPGATWPDNIESVVQTYDLSNAAAPVDRGRFVTDRIHQNNYYWYGNMDMRGGMADCFDCGYYGYNEPTAVSVPGGLVFLQRHPQQELLGTQEWCSVYPAVSGNCNANGWCTYYSGSEYCTSLNGGPETCDGAIQHCIYDSSGTAWSCTDVDSSTIPTTESCYSYDQYRYWQSFSLEILDLTGPTPTLAPSVALPVNQEGLDILADGSSVWVSYRVPVEIAGDARGYARHFIQSFDLTQPSAPVAGAAINVPGQLIGIEGSIIHTQDTVWGQDSVETSIAQLELLGNRAHLQSTRRFADQWVTSVVFDDAGHVLVTHRNNWYGGGTEVDYRPRLTILGIGATGFDAESTTILDDWAYLKDAKGGKALFQVSGGVLVYDIADISAPRAQAYFPTYGWPRQVILDGNQAILPAGRYGVYAFDLSTDNLLIQ